MHCVCTPAVKTPEGGEESSHSCTLSLIWTSWEMLRDLFKSSNPVRLYKAMIRDCTVADDVGAETIHLSPHKKDWKLLEIDFGSDTYSHLCASFHLLFWNHNTSWGSITIAKMLFHTMLALTFGLLAFAAPLPSGQLTFSALLEKWPHFKTLLIPV